MAGRRALAAAVFATAALYAADAWAADKWWIGTAGNPDWSTNTNWSLTQNGPANTTAPASADRARIPQLTAVGAQYPQIGRLGVQTLNCSQLVVNAGATLTIQNGSTLNINGFAAPYIDGTGTVATVGTGRLRVTDQFNPGLATGIFVNQSITLGNVTLDYNGGGNVNSCRMVVNNPAVVLINGDLDMVSASLQLGQNPNGTVTEVNVRGNITISNKSVINFKTNGSILHCGKNYTQGGQRIRDGTDTTMIFDGTDPLVPQVVSQDNATLGSVNFQNVRMPKTTNSTRTVIWLNNPQLADGFQVVGDLTVGGFVNFILQDNVAAGGIGSGTADTFRIESGATARFEGGYTCASTLLFRNASDASSSDGVLRMQGTIGTFAGAFTSGIGTVEYAGNGANQAVAASLGPYYNLVIDNKSGAIATQQAAALSVTNTLTIGKTVPGVTNTASAFTSAATTVTVGNDFVCNAGFTHAGSTVNLTAAFDQTASIKSDIAAPAALTFNVLQVNAPARTVTAERSFSTAGAFTVLAGTLNTLGGTSPITLTALLGMSIGDGAGAAASAVFNLLGGDTVAVASTRIFQVNAVDGRFTALAGANGTPTLTHSTGSFAATINGQANILGLNFSFGDASGLNFTATSTIERLRKVRFTNVLAGAGSRHLTVTSPGLDLDCPGCFFDTVAGNQFNVWAVDSNVGNGVALRLRFENRTTSAAPGSIGGPGAGEPWDGDDDTNDDGQILAPETTTLHGGAIVQWVYTANVDMTGAIQGFPMPAFDWTTFSVYSTYVLMRNSSGATDSIYVLDGNGDLKPYSFTLPGADIVGPLLWSTEPSGRYVYFGTSAGEVYRLIDNGSSLVAAGGSWSTPYTDSTNLLAVTSPVMSDGVNLYFAGQASTAPIFALYKVEIATKSAPNPRISLSNVLVTTGFSWWDTLAGRYIYGASQASGGFSYIGRAVASSWTIDAVFASPSLNPPAADCTSNFNGNVNVAVWAFGSTPYLYAAEENGYVHAVMAAGTAAEFSTQRPGYPFRDKVSAVRSGVVVEFGTGRVFFGNDAGDLYTMGTFGAGWVLDTNYFRLATPGGLPLQGMPLYSYGVLYASNTGGKVFVVDANNGAGQTLARTYNLGLTALGDISRDPEFGRIYVASAGGRLYAIDSFADPTPGAP